MQNLESSDTVAFVIQLKLDILSLDGVSCFSVNNGDKNRRILRGTVTLVDSGNLCRFFCCRFGSAFTISGMIVVNRFDVFGMVCFFKMQTVLLRLAVPSRFSGLQRGRNKITSVNSKMKKMDKAAIISVADNQKCSSLLSFLFLNTIIICT